MRKTSPLVLLLAFALLGTVPGYANSEPERVTLCHSPGTPAEKTLTLPRPAAEAHLRHGDRLGSCESGVPCAAPPAIPTTPAGTEPQDEPEFASETVAQLEGADEKRLNPVGSPITFRLNCATLNQSPDSVAVYDNGAPVPYASLTTTADSVTLTGGVGTGRHELVLSARDVYGYSIDSRFVVWAGEHSVPVLVVDESGAPVAGATVTAKLSDDPDVSSTLTSGADGGGVFANLPNRSYNIVAQASGNRFATQPTSVFDGTAVLRLRGIGTPSTVDNNDFSQGLDGWDIGTAPVSLVPHIEDTSATFAVTAQGDRTPEASTRAGQSLATPGFSAAAADVDLALTTSGEGQQSISRTFTVEPGVKSVTVRYRFITSEVPGGYFGSEFNDFYNVTARSAQSGGVAGDGNSMNGLGLAAFDAAGATGWREAELPVDGQGDTVRVDVAVANVADGLYDSQVVVDVVKKKKLTVSQVQLRDIEGTQNLSYLSASAHTYFGGQTRVHGTITVQGPQDESLTSLTLEVLQGGVIATGTLATAVRPTLLTTFGTDEQNSVTSSQLLFEIPAAQLAAANQAANGQLTLRVRARSSSGETAEKDAGSVTKLVRFTGANRYGGRDEAHGGDDWAKPTVRSFIANAGLTWGDFSNMNGGAFAPHASHQTGNSADGWFSGYNNRDATTAATIIGHLNTHGTRIRTVYVTFAAGSAFANAIANVTLADGRPATSVIRNHGGHTTHFHWEVTD